MIIQKDIFYLFAITYSKIIQKNTKMSLNMFQNTLNISYLAFFENLAM